MDKPGFISALVGLLTAFAAVSIFADATGSPDPEPVAVVSLVSGHAFVSGPEKKGEQELLLLDRLVPGQTVRTADSSYLVLTYFTGQRFKLLESATAKVMPDAPATTQQGKAVRLSPVATVPSLSPIAAREAPSATAAVRLRHETVQQPLLEPADSEAVLAESCVLRFKPLPEVSSYRVRVENQALETVLEVTNDTGEVIVPSDSLQPGGEYIWSVCPLNKGRAPECRRAVFFTLAKEQLAMLNQLATEARESKETDMLVLLAELKRCLRLHRQACDELAAAVGPGHKAVELFDCGPTASLQ